MNRKGNEHQGALLPEWRFSLRFDTREIWIGLRWDRLNMKSKGWQDNPLSVRICLIPCFPFHIQRVLRNERYPKRAR